MLALFDLRSLTDIDLLFLNDVDKHLLGKTKTFSIHEHAFTYNLIGKKPWGQAHLTSNINEWDLFYDSKYHGYCFGMKFASLKQVASYKNRRKEPHKDDYDVNKILNFLKEIKTHFIFFS